MLDEQACNCDHNSRDGYGQKRKEQKITQYYWHEGFPFPLPCKAQRAIPRVAVSAVPDFPLLPAAQHVTPSGGDQYTGTHALMLRTYA
jgi:hypothetical protein